MQPEDSPTTFFKAIVYPRLCVRKLVNTLNVLQATRQRVKGIMLTLKIVDSFTFSIRNQFFWDLCSFNTADRVYGKACSCPKNYSPSPPPPKYHLPSSAPLPSLTPEPLYFPSSLPLTLNPPFSAPTPFSASSAPLTFPAPLHSTPSAFYAGLPLTLPLTLHSVPSTPYRSSA